MTQDKTSGSVSVVQSFRAEKIRQLMTAPAVIVEESVTVLDAVSQMRESKRGCALVGDGQGNIRGIFTERDYLEKIAGAAERLQEPVATHMTPDPVTVSPEGSVGQLLAVISEGGYRNIPVVEDGRIEGIVTVLDIVKYIADLFPTEVYNLPPDFDQVMPNVEGA